MATRALRSVISSNHQRTPSSKSQNNFSAQDIYIEDSAPACLTSSTKVGLKEGNGNRSSGSASSKQSQEMDRDGKHSFETRSKRSASLKSLLSKDKGTASTKKQEKQGESGLKKSKSSTSLSALITRPKSSRGKNAQGGDETKNKENCAPNSAVETAAPPIWAQFATQEVQSPTKVPLNDVFPSGRGQDSGERQMQLPSRRGRIVPDYSEKALPSKPRPRSEVLSSSSSMPLFADKSARTRASQQPNPDWKTTSKDDLKSTNKSVTRASDRSNEVDRSQQNARSQEALTIGTRGSRVKAAVAALNVKSKPLPSEPSPKSPVEPHDPETIGVAFEALLETRNVPENTRDKMRALDTSIKANLIKQDKASSNVGVDGASPEKSADEPSIAHVGSSHSRGKSEAAIGGAETPKRARPRSLTFTLNKSDQSPSKKPKSEGRFRSKSRDRSRPGSRSCSQTGQHDTAPSAGKAEKSAKPEQFITYLRKVQKPEAVEVGKIHKLQQLLRNESVTWVDAFVMQNGMTELLELLDRVMAVEWREEHEDTLLHNLLLCLKALSTTSSAMTQLSSIQSTLFPKLIGMLYDEEKKGPSEYTTRTLIINLLFNYLSLSSSSTPADRATALVKYLQDPSPPEEVRPLGFISSIWHPRPFKIWKKELDNLTKEVFWIFLHHTNIVPFPLYLTWPLQAVEEAETSYRSRHYPREHLPRPAAPYIGGVEWDATNYVTAHLDLLNGLLASLPTREDRNGLRQQLRDSGMEKVMGGYLRLCKEKFYGCVHESLSTWIGAAREDGWPVRDVREGPPREMAATKSPRKKQQQQHTPAAADGGAERKGEERAPRLEGLKLDVGIGGGSPEKQGAGRTELVEGWF